MLVLNGIKKDYVAGDTEVHALRGLDITFRENEFVSILGPSGCGKTTLLNIIGGLDKYDGGDLLINGRSTKGYKDSDWDTYRNHSIGFVFQSYNLIPHQSVLANVELALTLSGVSKAERRERAKKVLIQVGLEDQLHKKPSQMSGGQMQRVAIARALVNNPDILLADEPTGALDTETSTQIMDILRDISHDKLIIMVTHNPDLAEKYSSRTIKLLDGEIIDDSNPYVPGESEGKDDSGRRFKKPSMSFVTALSLSMRNLLTKKTRTFLTAFAGSIGIIGIALILSLSSGLQGYIDRMQEDTLSSYPVTIEKTSMDITSMMTSMMGMRESAQEHELNQVYSMDIMSGMMDTMVSEITTNNLEDFMSFLEDDANGVNELVNDIKYGYSTPLNIYKSDTDDGVLQVNPSQVFDAMGMSRMMGGSDMASSMGMSMVGTDVWEQLIGNEELLSTQYDVIAGKMPSEYNEAVVIVTEDNEVTDYALYALGLKDTDELSEFMKSVMKGEEAHLAYEETSYSYEEILDLTFKLVPTSSYYEKNEDGLWVDRRDDEDYMAGVVNDATEVKIVGILRPNEDAVTTSVSGVIGYSAELMTHLIDEVENSEIVKEQKANPETDIFTGLEFPVEDEEEGEAAETPAVEEEPAALTMEDLNAYILTLPEAEQMQAAQSVEQMQLAGMSDDEILAVFADQMPAPGGEEALTMEELNAYLETLPDEERASIEETIAQMQGMGMSDDEILAMFAAQMPSESDPTVTDATYDGNLTLMGVADHNSPSSIYIYPKDFSSKEVLLEKINDYNKDMEAAGKDENIIQYSDLMGIMMSSMSTIINTISYVLIAFVSISLVVSSIMIGIITYISVLERTKEIGILRSIGASKRDISNVFNAETLIVGFTSGAFGIIVTMLLCIPANAIIKNLTGISNIAQLPIDGAVILILISMVLTFISGLIPSRIAARKDPAVALRAD